MTNTEALYLLLGGAGSFVGAIAAARLLRAFTIPVEDNEAVLVTSHGKLTDKLTRPGLHFYPSAIFPWVKTHRIPLSRDFRDVKNIHVNDANGTTVIVDIWIEFRIVDPEKALFGVDDWEKALHNIVSHSSISMLGNRVFKQILCDRDELGELVREDVADETGRWGIGVEHVFVRNVSLLPDVSRQVFESVAARLERSKAGVEEEGRLRVALLEAETSARIAELVADAKAQYPLAVGRALGELKKNPPVFAAYNELYDLSLYRPHKTHAFVGFGNEMRATDAAMVIPPKDVPPARVTED